MTTHRAMPPNAPTPPSFSLEDTQPIRSVRPRRGIMPWLIRIPLLMVAGLFLLALLGAFFIFAHQTQYASLIYPGVSTYGLDLSGLSYDQAVALLDERFISDEQAVFTFRDGDAFWQVTAGDLGVTFDVRGTVDQAMLQGRGGNFVENLLEQSDIWFAGRSVSPIVFYDQRVAESFLRGIANEVNRPTRDATVVLRGTEVITTGSQVGRNMDIAATLSALRGEILELGSGAEIPLVINETPPTVWEVAQAAASLQAALSGPISLYAESASGERDGPWVAAPETLAGMLVLERVDHADGSAGYDVHLDPEQLLSFMNGIAPDLVTEPLPARFTFNDETGQLELLQASLDGRALDVERSLAAIEATLFTPSYGEVREVALTFDYVAHPIHSTATAAELGIVELVSEATTYYLGSTASRQSNIDEAASRFNGVVIGPGAEFSFNEWLGDVSLDSGFEESLIILNGRTIRGVGGGVCQVSTTAYQVAFYAGFPILERLPHGYRVGYYEHGEGVGMDATIYSPLVDFRFLNDTPYHLLVETEANREAATLTFRFYSTDVGRYVEKIGPRITEVTPHGDVVYEENAELLPGQRRQVEWAVDGAQVTVTRQVWRNGELESEDHFFSQYVPWNAVIQVAPGELPDNNTSSG